MMPYAANGIISTDDFKGSIRITDEQYREALDGMRTGLRVTIEDGFKVVLVPPPERPLEPEPTPEDLTVSALLERDQRLSVAAIRIAPLQDAVDLGDATENDLANLKSWKQYRVALNRVELQVTFPQAINWPIAPGATEG